MSDESFRERYERLADDDLLRIVDVRTNLVPEAALALDREIERRHLEQPEAPTCAKNPKITQTRSDFTFMMLKCCAIFALFAACGAVSAAVFCRRFPDMFSPFFPLPFAVLLAILLAFVFHCTLDRVLLAAVLAIMVWYASSIAAFFAGAFGLGSAIPCALGGLIGGIGLVFCTSVRFPRMVSVKYFAVGAIIGACSALTFIPGIETYELHLSSGGFPPTPIGAFAFWNATMGTYLFAFCTLAPVRGADEHSPEGDVGSFRVTPR